MMHAPPRDRYTGSSNEVKSDSLIGCTRITADDLVLGNTSRWLGLGLVTNQTRLHDRLRVMREFGLDGFVLNGMDSSYANITGRGKPWVGDTLSPVERTFTIVHIVNDVFQCTFDGLPVVSFPSCDSLEFIDRFMILFFVKSSFTDLWYALRKFSRMPRFNFTIDDPHRIGIGFITGSGVPHVSWRGDKDIPKTFAIAVSAHDPDVPGKLKYSLYFLDRHRKEFTNDNADLSAWDDDFIRKINQHFTG